MDNTFCKSDRYPGSYHDCNSSSGLVPWFVAAKIKFAGRKGIKKLSRQKEQAYLNCKVDYLCSMGV